MFFQSKPKPEPQPEARKNAELLLGLYKQHYRLWYYHASRVLNAQDDEIDDLIHDVFIRMMTSHMEQLRAMNEPSRLSYISRAVHNAALKKVQARSREVATDEIELYCADQAAPDPAALLEQKVTLEIFERAFQRLPERMRELLYCKFFDDLPDNEIAERLGVQPSSLRSALSRARAALRTEIAKEEQS